MLRLRKRDIWYKIQIDTAKLEGKKMYENMDKLNKPTTKEQTTKE